MTAKAFDNLLEVVNVEFPKELTLVDGSKLERSILYIPPELENGEDNKKVELIPNAVNLDENKSLGELILSEMLHLLDDNLGRKYRRVNYEIYGNKRGWKRNKWDEMLSPGLCYVYYCKCIQGKRSQTPIVAKSLPQVQLFLSFMLTKLDRGRFQSQNLPVLYLYELQLRSQVRSQGLGTFLLNTCLRRCCQSLNRGQQDEGKLKGGVEQSNVPRGIALTVFGDNRPALRLYRDKLDMEIVESQQRTGPKRITRSSHSHCKKGNSSESGDIDGKSKSNSNSNSNSNNASQGSSTVAKKSEGVPREVITVNPPLYLTLLMRVSGEPSISDCL